jgi:predicted Rdx family selenoprotein
VHFVIHYRDVPPFEDEALALARRLFASFDEAIDSLTLVPGDGDELDLYLDGNLVHSYRQSGRAPRVSDLPGPWRDMRG